MPTTLRLVLAVSLDGRLAPPGGGPAQLGGAADRRALEEALAWADACLLGAETLRLHGSTCLIHHADLLEDRRRAGRPPQPVAVVASRSGRFPATLPFWSQPLQRWLLGPASAAGLSGFHRHLPLAPWPELLAALAAQGLDRLVLLGGAALAASLLEAGLVDELQLTLCPLLLGGEHLWLPAATRLPQPQPLAGALRQAPWHLQSCRPLEGGECLLHFRREPVFSAGLPPPGPAAG
ncbi:dihydrofolate reductase family protein [Cyanobium sp. NIES-981]|uniref:dihydrofolate reductase family protein n=1 Tax=Cyanobium sp. NIES-981 TaxID=1851505 RepID=UPI0007DD2E05|nr:dihydrofolate reductase family protein [Cyanobium sp. NIES-981]SBO44795.1 Riboflavin biosynthesis protein RibD C-terminal domain protein [Cyanobium sp. NIES-981]